MDGKKRIVGLVILLLLLFPGGVCGTEIAAEDDSFSVLEDAVEDLDRIMGDHLSLEKLYHDIISGDFSFSPAAVLSAVQELIFQELRVSVSLFGQLFGGGCGKGWSMGHLSGFFTGCRKQFL